MNVKIKICGITCPEDARAVARAGADAIGLNFAKQSPRLISLAMARELADEVAGCLIRVGLFVDSQTAVVDGTLAAVDLDVLQFHGQEPADYCRSFGVPYVKAVRVDGVVDIQRLEAEYHDACCLLLDTYVGGTQGGTGQSFDWSLWPKGAGKPLVLAGGLSPENVAGAIRQTQPAGVDVSGGVETDRKGQKDLIKVMKFVQEVRGVGI